MCKQEVCFEMQSNRKIGGKQRRQEARTDDAELRDNKEIPASVKENYGKRTGGDQLVYITCEGEVS